MFDILQPHELQHARLSCPPLSPGVCSDSCPLRWWYYLTILSSATLFSCPQSFPASGSFPMSQLFISCGQSIGSSASASVLPMNIQGWFPLELTGLVFLPSKGLSDSSLAPRFKSISSSALSLSYGPALTSVHYYWKNHRFYYMDLCWQGDICAF